MDNDPEKSRGQVLIADDEPSIREGLAQVLSRFGFVCEIASTASEAKARLEAAEFDAFISDIHMPGNTSLELIETIPQLAAGLPVVLLTGRPSVETAARSVRLAVAAYLTKPPEVDELCRVLDQAIAGYRGFRAMRAGRERLRVWERELEQIEQTLRHAPGAGAGGPMGSYLRVSLRQVIMTLADLERITQSLEHQAAGSPVRLDHVAALQRTVEVLERTKQNFKSKELAELRRQIEQLLNDTGGSGI